MSNQEGVLTGDDEDVVDTSDDKTKNQAPPAPEVDVIEEDTKDERLDVTGQAEEDDDERHDRKRETAKERRERAKLAKERDRRELEFQRMLIKDLEGKLESVSKQTITAQALTLKQQLDAAREEETRFAAISAQAQQANNVTDAFTAERVRDDASRRAAQLESQLQHLARQHAAPKQQVPAFIPYAKAFMEGKPWYDSSGRNEDSAIVNAIDKVLANEPGMDPRQQEYWAELERRVAKKLPHRFAKNNTQDAEVDVDDEPEDDKKRRGPPVGGGRSTAATSPTQIRLSPERVKMLKEANLWDDPVMRKRMALRYAEFDRNNSARR
jgi:hypothetical protein